MESPAANPCDPKRYLEKKHICSICGYRTTSNWHLSRHYKSCYRKYENYIQTQQSQPVQPVPPPTPASIVPQPNHPLPPPEQPIHPLPTPVVPQPNHPRPVVPQPNHSKPVVPQPNHPRPVVPQPNHPTPVVPQPNLPTPVVPQPNHPKPVVPQPNHPRLVVPQPNLLRPVVPQPNHPSPIVPQPTPTPIQKKREQGDEKEEQENEATKKRIKISHKEKREGESVFIGKNDNLNNPIDCRLIENFKIYISGPSRCGKSVFLVSLLKNMEAFMKEPPEVICFVYVEYQSEIYDQLRNGIVDYFIQDDDQLERNIKGIVEEGKRTLIIYDDLINSNNLSFISKQFTVNGRHNGISQVFVSQKLFPKDDYIRLISNNSDYLVLFKNPRNAAEIKILSNQMSRNALSKIFQEATLDPYSYLFIDLTQECIPQKRYLSHLFDSDIYMYTYIEN